MGYVYELALFAGGGGGLLASKWLLGWRSVCYVEWDRYAVEILKARIRDGYLDDAPIWSDVRSFTKRNNQCRPFIRALRALADDLVLTAGFPCQPFSVAGKQLGADDARNGWPATIRIIRELRPRYCLLENVPGLLSCGYFGQVLGDLAASGYDTRWDCLSAAAVGANHQRDRLWIVAADANRDRSAPTVQSEQECWRSATPEPGSHGEIRSVAHADGSRRARDP